MSSLENRKAGNKRQQLLFGLYIDALRMDEVVARCSLALKARRQELIGVVNAAKLVNMRNDSVLHDSLLECDTLLADGQSVVWASRILGHPLPERVAGIDLFERLLELAHRDGWSVYLLGAKADVLQKLEEKIQEKFPGLKIAGRRDGYFKDTESSEVAAAIRDSKADMLFLGMSSPKKEIFVGQFAKTMNVPILHGVGGSFDVMSGLTKRAPLAWQKMGMEWAYRLLQEPRRMWRRYLTTNLGFIAMTARELFRATPAYQSKAIGNPVSPPNPEN